MREQLFLNNSARQSMLRIMVVAVLFASLMIGVAWPATGQVTSPGVPPAAGMGATSPLTTQSTRPGGIGLGATEIPTPGISPIVPSQGMGMTACGGSSSASSSTRLFDGGGLSGSAPLSCADSQPPSSILPPSSSMGGVGIPLGATELGGAGISTPAPVAGPNSSSSASPAGNPANP